MTKIWTASGAEEILAALGIESVEDAWKSNLPGELVNDRGDRQVLRIRTEVWNRAIYLKRWRFPPGSLARLLPGKSALRNRGATELRNLQDLRTLGIRVPTPLFFGEAVGLFGPVASILGLENLEGCVCALDWGKGRPPEDLAAIGRGVGRILGTLHRAGVYHRSPGLKHFYLDLRQPEADFAMLDVPRLDRIDPQTPPGKRSGWGGDFPCPERDLSKALLAVRESFPDPGALEAAFWEAYVTAGGASQSIEELKKTVDEQITRRSKDRVDRKANRNS